MAQHAILRFEKHKGNPARPLEAHHERQKEQYASNPDIDTSRSKYNFHIVKPDGRYYHFIQNRIEQAGCRTRKDSTRFVDTLITASPEFFKKKSPKEIQEFFQRAADFLIGRVGKENIVSAVVHMDEKTPQHSLELGIDFCYPDLDIQAVVLTTIIFQAHADVKFQGAQHIGTLFSCAHDCRHDSLLQHTFFHCGRMVAVSFAKIQPVDAPPDRFLFTLDRPGASAIWGTAFPTDK